MAAINNPSIHSTPSFNEQGSTTSRGTQTDSIPVADLATAPPQAQRATPGQHPLANRRTSTDTVTGSGTPQAYQAVKMATIQDAVDGHGNLLPGKSDASTGTHLHDSVRTPTWENVKGLFHSVDNQISVGLEQDAALSEEIARAGQMPTPRGTLASDCVCLPPDLMAYRVPTDDKGGYKLRYNCPEINGTGFGGIRDFHPEQLQQVMNTYGLAGEEIMADAHSKGEQPLVLVANSGREGAQRNDNGEYNKASNSKMIWEKMYIADVIGESFSTKQHEVFGDSLDKHISAYYKDIDAINGDKSLTAPQQEQKREEAYAAASKRMAEHKDKPMVLLGYSRDMAACCRVDNGRPTLFGRPVHGAVNDRGLQNLAMTEGKPLEFTKFRPMNATVTEGVDKFAASIARAEFLKSDAFKELEGIATERGFKFDAKGLEQIYHFEKNKPEPIDVSKMNKFEQFEKRSTYFRSIKETNGDKGRADVEAAIKDFNAIGLKVLVKPNGTGQSKGILAQKPDESAEDFNKRFEANLKTISEDFGAGAGFPFLVMPMLKLDETPENEAYDLRFATYQNTDNRNDRNIRSVPLILKKEPPKAKPSGSNEPEFSPTNVTAAVKATGKKGTDFIVSLASQEGMEKSHLDLDAMKSTALYFSAFQKWLLETNYPRPQTEHSNQSRSTIASSESDSGDSVERPTYGRNAIERMMDRLPLSRNRGTPNLGMSHDRNTRLDTDPRNNG